MWRVGTDYTRYLIAEATFQLKIAIITRCNREITFGTAGLPLKFVWDNQIPARINFFLWEVKRHVVITKSLLCGIFPERDQGCALCTSVPKTLDHLLLNCVLTKLLWAEIAKGIGVQLPHHDSVSNRIKF